MHHASPLNICSKKINQWSCMVFSSSSPRRIQEVDKCTKFRVNFQIPDLESLRKSPDSEIMVLCFHVRKFDILFIVIFVFMYFCKAVAIIS